MTVNVLYIILDCVYICTHVVTFKTLISSITFS